MMARHDNKCQQLVAFVCEVKECVGNDLRLIVIGEMLYGRMVVE